MGLSFWIRRAATVFVLFAAILFVVSLMKGRGLGDAVAFSAGWAAASTALFITTRVVRSRRGEACALCQDTPEAVPVEAD